MSAENERSQQHEEHHCAPMLFKSKWVLVGFLIVAGYFLFTEHRAHTIAFLPYALLLACPLMHVFMHHGHGHHHGNSGDDNKKEGS